MNHGAPNGHFADDLILFGALEEGSRVAKGYVLRMHDQRGASVAQLNAYQDKVRSALALFNDGMSGQLQWSCSSDYGADIMTFDRETDGIAHPHVKRVRRRMARRAWERMSRRELRREDVVLFISTKVASPVGKFKASSKSEIYYKAMLGQLRSQFDEWTGTLQAIFGADTTVTPLSHLAHFTYFSKFLNPSLAERFDADFSAQFNPALTIQENCWNSDGVGLRKIGFYLDGRYHSVFTLKRWPSRTHPGIIFRLTGLPFLDYQITVNFDPLPTKREVDNEEKAVERLSGEYRSTGRHSLLVAVEKKKHKIESLSTGFIRPFAVTYIIRVWDKTETGLGAKCAAIKNAIQNLNGAQYYECGLPSTAKRLFFASWPGWTGSPYNHRTLYAEDSYLADLLPLSATFTGHLASAEAVFPGSQNNLVGVCSFIGSPPSPQHALASGATGAGKSRFVNALPSQNAHRFLYTMLIEEALPRKTVVTPPPMPPLSPPTAAPVAGSDLDQANMETVRISEALKSYPVGRYVDPADPSVMHEAHVVYRKEAGASWNLNPNAPTVVPLGPVLAVADPARSPNPLPAELEQKMAEQNQLVASLIEQNEALARELTKLGKEMKELRQQTPNGTKTP
ncbi:MAG: hypothetical protein ACREIA_04595 [Opitutaceae bacterium]